ncbi:MAG TPA: NapC/NirT family cytochrome c [Bacteroidota bacterium]
MKRRLPAVFYNPISLAGAAIASVTFATIAFLTVVDQVMAAPPAYFGIIAYVVLPVPLILGLVVVLVGIVRERSRRKKGMQASRIVFTLNLEVPEQRNAVTYFSIIFVVFLLFTAYGSYQAFQWTESVEFCGKTCHTVMEPEFTAYQYSPHARVRCVDCHVGGGAGWYVRSKLSGAYQLYAVLANNFPRPIPIPIKNLRPAQETCEQCHWPAFFSGEKEELRTYFKSDEKNTRWTVDLLMKVGGGGAGQQAPSRGIHWHMNIAEEMTYVANDSLEQSIPWVRARNKNTGQVTEYVSTDETKTVDELKKLTMHKLDCIGCHNQPSHSYRPPVRLVDQSLAQGKISTELPNVRMASIQALVTPYATTAAAMDSIPQVFLGYYKDHYPVVADQKKDLIAAASEELKTQYSRNFFPEMNVNWQAYPNNVGHMTNLGCFRCHDGKHKSAEGKTIPKDCNSCHTILYQGTAAAPATLNSAGLAFQHPEDVGDAWKETNCSDCHTGQ